MEKSYVGMGHELCPICGAKHGEVVLLDRRLKNSLHKDMAIGCNLCPDCAKQAAEYVALVAIDESKSLAPFTPATAWRTGDVAWVRRSAAASIFNVPISDSSKFVYTEPAVIQQLQTMQPKE